MWNSIDSRGAGLRWRRLAITVVPAFLFCLLGQPASANWIKLSDGQSFSDIFEFKISPDGHWVVFKSNADDFNTLEIYSVPITGGVPVRLNGPLTSPAGVLDFEIDTTSSRVVYIADQATVGVNELFSVSIAGGPTVRLSDNLVAGGNVSSFQISPDGTRVVYRADQAANNFFEIFAVEIFGGAEIRLNAPSGVFSVESFQISPDGTRVVYRQANVIPPLPGGIRIDIAINSTSIGGGVPVRINGAYTSEQHIVGGDYQISPNSERVVFTEAISNPLGGPNFTYFRSATLFGGDPIVLSTGSGSPFPNASISSFQFTPNSSRVIFRGNHETPVSQELFSVPVTGGMVDKLSAPIAAGGSIFSFSISPDSSRVVYRGDVETDGIAELFSVSATGGGATKLNDALAANQDVLGFEIDSNSTWVAYCATDGGFDLPIGHRVPVSGPAVLGETIWGGPVLAIDDCQFSVEPKGDFAILRGFSALVDSTLRLWQANLSGTPETSPTELVSIDDFQPDGDVALPLLVTGSPFSVESSGTVVYVADQENDEEYELYAVPLILFADGFESGDTSAWSATAP
jgi:Tol biopolymer transport system component